jgi:hypothetical protein
MIKESKSKIVWDYIWITVVIAVVMFGSIMIPMSCNAQEYQAVPDRKAYWQSPTLAHEFDIRMETLRELRDDYPEFDYLVQVWANMETGEFIFVNTAGKRYEVDGKVTWEFRIFPKMITTYDFRNSTGLECIMAYYLTDYEWFHGRNGDI